MNDTPFPDHDPIDAVITWVNGDSAAHRRKRHAYMAKSSVPLHENATNPHRWACNDEILFCLQSIGTHAEWIRTIWIVVDDETPDLSILPAALTSKVKFVFHRDIFDGFNDVLPTFNSLSIESMIWRIEGLSERFLYFNDDVFLTAPVQPTDVFKGTSPVLRGKWASLAALTHNFDAQKDPSLFNHFMQINAAEILGFGATQVFCAAHVAHPCKRSTMSELFEHYHDVFKSNISHRFRDLSQFLPQGLHNHACILENDAIISPMQDYRHIRSGQGQDRAPTEAWALLENVSEEKVKFLCINDLPKLEALIPGVRGWLGDVVGAA